MKKKISKLNRVRKVVLAVICVALLFCPVFVFADETTTAAPDQPYDITTTDVTNDIVLWYQGMHASDICQTYYSGKYEGAEIETVTVTEIDQGATGYKDVYDELVGKYGYGEVFAWYDVDITANVELDIDGVSVDAYGGNGYIKYATSFNHRVAYSLPNVSGIVQLDTSIDSFEVISNNGTVAYSAKVNGTSSTATNITFYVTGDVDSNFTDTILTYKYHTRVLMKRNWNQSVSGNEIGSADNVGLLERDFYIKPLSVTATLSNVSVLKALALSGSEISYLDHIDEKLFDLWETENLTYHELYQMHTELIGTHTTLAQVLTVLSNYASRTGNQLGLLLTELSAFRAETDTSLEYIITLLGSNENYNSNLYQLLNQTFNQNPSSLATEFDEAISNHESHEEVAISAIESAAPVVDQQIEQLKEYDTRTFWETNRTAATFWKTVLNKFFDNTVLGVVASFLIIINIILLVKFILRL